VWALLREQGWKVNRKRVQRLRRRRPPVSGETMVQAGAEPVLHILHRTYWDLSIRHDGSARFGVAIGPPGHGRYAAFPAGTFDYDDAARQLAVLRILDDQEDYHALPAVGVVLDPRDDPACQLYALGENLTVELFGRAFAMANDARLNELAQASPLLRHITNGKKGAGRN